jgi:hypothetical protein
MVKATTRTLGKDRVRWNHIEQGCRDMAASQTTPSRAKPVPGATDECLGSHGPSDGRVALKAGITLRWDDGV